MDDTIIMDSVIQKYFAGETSEQEEKYLLAWLEESEEHRKYFFELKSLWGARRVFEESTDLSRFASFMRSTDHRIGSIVAGERSTRRRRLVRWTLGAAAAVLLAVCAGTAWHFLSTPDIYRVYENTGDAVTTVTLDDGTHVWLNARTKLTLPDAAQRAVGRRGLLRGGAGRSRPVRRVHRQTARARAGHLLLHAGLRRFAAGRSRPRTRFRTPSDARRGQPGDAATRPARPVRTTTSPLRRSTLRTSC